MRRSSLCVDEYDVLLSLLLPSSIDPKSFNIPSLEIPQRFDLSQ
jgi:hypothetical protein